MVRKWDKPSRTRPRLWELLSVFLLPTASIACAVVYLRSLMPRRDPRIPFRDMRVAARDGVEIAVTHIPRRGGKESDQAVVMAHPAVTGRRYEPLVELAEEMTCHFDVFTLDFRGHGDSAGVLDLERGLEGPVADLEAVVRLVRGLGYRWVGAVGFSLGGMAAFALACQKPDMLDALAVVGMPPRFPDIGFRRRWLPLWFLFLRGMGARFSGGALRGPAPLDLAVTYPEDKPLLVVHGGKEMFYPQEDLQSLLRSLRNKAELLWVDDAGHAELGSGRERFLNWLVTAADVGESR